METVLSGILLGLSITAPVGPTNIEVIRRGLKAGWQSSVLFCLGVMVALLGYLILAVFGLSFLTGQVFFNLVLLSFGVLVLFYLAFNAVKDFFSKREYDLIGNKESKKHFVPGIVLTISNPAVLVLWTGILGADLAAGSASFFDSVLLIGGILAGVILFFSALNFLIFWGGKNIKRKYFKYISLAAGIILLYFAFSFGYKLLTVIYQAAPG